MAIGKIIGALFGAMFGGFYGMLFGVWVGHYFDIGLAQESSGFQRIFTPFTGASIQVQEIFFESTFSIMGHIAKADGRVSEREIEAARAIMARMGLSHEKSLQAMQLFNRGKEPGFSLEQTLALFSRVARNRFPLVQMFLEIQLQVAMADGRIAEGARPILRKAANVLGFPPEYIDRLADRVNAETHFHRRAETRRPQHTLKEAYRVMGVSETVSPLQLKKAYRKLMSEHHPDKLAAKGLPPEMMRLATEKTQQIQEAYEAILKERGW